MRIGIDARKLHDFGIGTWKPLKEVRIKDSDGDDHDLYLWIIGEEAPAGTPEKVAPPAEVKKDDKKSLDREPDVIYLPTPQPVVDKMLELAEVKKDDVVYDLGCGDGRIVITAVKDFGAKRGVGVDIEADLVDVSRIYAREAGVADRLEFRKGDVLDIKDLADASVVMLYMGEDVNLRLRPIFQKTLKPGSRIVSHDFPMGDWKPEKKLTVLDDDGDEHDIYLWIVGR